MMPTVAMVLAAGLGKRMRPLTNTKPKPLVPVAGETLIDRVLNWLAESGIQKAVVNTHYKSEMLAAHLVTRQNPAIQLSHEELLLETGGGIKKALPLIGDGPFFCTNSDSLCLDGDEPALHRLWNAWDDNTMDVLLLLYPVERAVGYEGQGDFFCEDGRITRRGDRSSAPLVFTGTQLMHPRLFANAPEGAFSLNVLYDRAINTDGSLARVRAVVHDGAWLHVGDPKGLELAEAFFAKNTRRA